MTRYLPNGQPVPKKRKKKPVTSAQQNKQGRGGQAPAEYKAPKPKPQKPRTIPTSALSSRNSLDKEDTLPRNITNLTVAAQNRGIRLTAAQAHQLLTATNKDWSTNEWGKFLVPGLAPDPFTGNMQQVLRDYYEWSGSFPDPTTMKNLVQNSKPGEPTKPPTVVPWSKLDLFDVLSDHANDKANGRADNNPRRVGGKGNRWALSDIEKWGSVKKADYMRALANAPQRTLDKEWDEDEDAKERITNSDIDRINEARKWYGGTTLKHIINKRKDAKVEAAQNAALINPDGTSNNQAIRLLASLTGQTVQDIRNPRTFVGLRDRAFGKDVINKKTQADLDKFGTILSAMYPDLKVPENGHYAWNQQFDKKASLYLFQSNIGPAVAENPHNKEGSAEEKRLWLEQDRKKQLAMANISIASYGSIKTNDDLRGWMQSAGFLAQKGETAMFSERFTNWLFADCYMKTQVTPNIPQEVAIFNYVRDWGGGNPESLPKQYRPFYDNVVDNFSFTLAQAAKAENNGLNPLGAIFDAELDQLQAWRDGLIPTPTSFGEKPVGPLKTENPALIRRDKRGAPLPEEQQDAEPVVYEKNGVRYTINEDGRFVVQREHRSNRLASGKGYKAMSSSDEITFKPGSFTERMMFDIMPLVSLPYDLALNEPVRLINTIYMTSALMAAHGGGESIRLRELGLGTPVGQLEEASRRINRGLVGDYGNEDGRLGTIEQTAAIGEAFDPRNLVIPVEANQYSWHNITESLAKARNISTDVNAMPWMRYQLESMGIDPEKNAGVLFWSDLAWSISLDFLMDGGIGMLARATGRTTASVMRSLSSKKLLARVVAAEEDTATAAALSLLDKAQIARKNGDNVLAASFENRANKVLDTGEMDDLLEATLTESELGKVRNAAKTWENMPEGPAKEKIRNRAARLSGRRSSELAADLQLMNRPAWYDTMAGSLATSKQHPIAVAELLGLKASQVPDPKNYLHYLRRIGESLDQDDIIVTMNYLSYIAKKKLDPGRLMWGRMMHFNSLQHGNNAYDEFNTVLPRDNRISGGIEDAEHSALVVWTATRGGMDPSKAKQANARMWNYIERLHALNVDATLDDSLRNYRRRVVWDEMMKEIETNVRAMPKSEGLFNDVVKYAKRNGMDTHEFERQWRKGKLDMWGLYNAMRLVKNSKSLGRVLARGGTGKSFFDEVQSTTPWLLAGKRTKGQQTGDLFVPFNLQDLASFMHGKARHQMAIYSKAGFGSIGILPSMMGVANFGRTFATASLAFPFSALFIDEIWRFIPEAAKGNVTLAAGKISADARKAAKEANKEFKRLISPDALESQIHEAHEFVGINALDSPEVYAEFINRWIAAYGKQDFTDEFSTFLASFKEDLLSHGMTNADIDRIPDFQVKSLFKEHLLDYIFHPDNADVRANMAHTGRGLKKDFRLPAEIEDQIEEFYEQLRMVDEITQSNREQLDELRLRRHELRIQEFEATQTRRVDLDVPLTGRQLRGVTDSLRRYQDDPTLQGFWKRFRERPNADTYGKLVAAIRLRLTRERDEFVSELEAYKKATPATTKETPAAPKPKTKEEALAEPAPKAAEPDFEPVKWGKRDEHDRWHAGEFVIQKDDEGWYHVGFADENGELDFGRANDSHDRLADAKATIDDPEKRAYLIETDEYKNGGTPPAPAADEVADFTDESIEQTIDSAPTVVPREGQDPDLELLQSQLDAVQGELDRINRLKGPAFRKETVDEEFGERTTSLQKLLSQVHRPVKRSWIFNWLDQNGYRSTYPNLYADGARMGSRNGIRGSFNNPREVKAWFDEVGIPDSEYNRMFYDYKAERLSKYGLGLDDEILQEEAELTARIEQLARHQREMRETRKQFKRIGPPKPNKLNRKANKYIDSVVDRIFLYYTTPELWDALQNGTQLTTKDIKALTARGVNLPDVTGVRGRKAGWFHSNGEVGWVPVLSAYAEFLPYRVMNWLGNQTRMTAFLGNFNVEYKALLDAGVDQATAIKAAQSRARDYVDSIMYSPGQTLKESQLGAYFYFLPAYRQAMKYWAKQFVEHPMVYNELRQRFGEDMPNQYWDGNYGTYIPMPMWLTNNPAEMTVPGVTMPLLMPMRALNSLTGWRHRPQDPSKAAGGKNPMVWKYTGETQMDWFAENSITSPLTGFASKNVSPLAVLDDFFYGALGEDSFIWMETDHLGLAAAASIGYSLRKDPMARRETATRILQAQISRGMRPNLDAYQANLKGSPWWYELLAGAGFEQPEAILGLVTRQLTPRKINYSPMDINIDDEQNHTGWLNMPKIGDKVSRNFFDTYNIFEDKEARTMGEAEYEFFQADGNKKKQAEILQRYPKLRKKYEFFAMDAYDREQYLIKPANKWIIPYITGKTYYDEFTGAPLTQGEYYNQMSRGAAIHKSNDEFLKAVNNRMINADWSQRLTILEKERDKRLKIAHKNMVELINEYSVTEKQRTERLYSLKGYEEKWWGKTPGNDFEDGKFRPTKWMNVLAKQKWGADWQKHFLEFDPSAIATAHWWNIQESGVENPNRPAWAPMGERPADANYEGIEGVYSNASFNKRPYEEGTGKALRISNALNRFMEPDDKAIFNMKSSMSTKAIEKSRKDHESYTQHAIQKVLNKQYYQIDSADELEAAIPGIFNPVTGIGTKEQMDEWLVDMDNAYQIKKDAIGAFGKSYGDKYDRITAEYDKTVARLMKKPIAALFRGGPATMLLLSPLVDPGEGKKFDRKYANMVAKNLLGKDVDYDDLVDAYSIGKTRRPEKAESANAWSSLLIASLAGRDRIEAARKADDGHIGDAQRFVATRLSNYADAWGRRSRSFRTQWGEQGGDDMIKTLLGMY